MTIKQLLCDHKYDTPYSWSYVQCSKCEQIKDDPKKASILWAEKFKSMYKDSDLLTNDVKKELLKRGVIV